MKGKNLRYFHFHLSSFLLTLKIYSNWRFLSEIWKQEICIFHHLKASGNISDNFLTLSDGYDSLDSSDTFSSVSVQNSLKLFIFSWSWKFQMKNLYFFILINGWTSFEPGGIIEYGIIKATWSAFFIKFLHVFKRWLC